MDSRQFDELVVRLASASNRRDALKGVAGGALASVVGVTPVVSAETKGKGKGKASAKNKGKGKGKTSAEHRRYGRRGKRQCKGQPPQTICHRGRQTITVSGCAVSRHLSRHGDTLGPCPYG